MAGGVEPLIRVTVARSAGGAFPAFTRRRGERIELLPVEGRLPPLDEGEHLALQRPIAGDALYEEPVIVTSSAVTGRSATVELAGDRRRHQQRDHVRVTTGRLTMELDEFVDEITVDGDDEDTAVTEPRHLTARILDISAGGARVEHHGDALPVGSVWQVSTVLEYDDGTELPVEQIAEIRWVLDPRRAAEVDDVDDVDEVGDTEDESGDDMDGEDLGEPQTVAGMRFMGIRPGLEESVTRWVFQQQSKWLRTRRQDTD